MPWDRGYYYRARKIEGRVVREYIGAGEAGQLASELDVMGRQTREAEQAAWRAMRDEIEAREASLNELNKMADLLAQAALLAAGFHQYKRGEWRKRRGQHHHTC